MNIKNIKSEFERLSQIITSWSDKEPIAAIERDLALDKLLKIYDMVRFADRATETATDAVTTPQEQADNNEPQVQDEVGQNDVEVEFIFADDQDVFEVAEENNEATEQASTPATIQEQEPQQSAQTVGEILAATIAASIATEEVKQPSPAQDDTASATPSDPKSESQVEPKAEPKSESKAEQKEVTPTPTVEPKTEPAPKAEPKVEAKAEPKAAPRPMNSLFGVEEPNHKPRTKHQRMMSIYNDAETRPEKAIDISKIFDLDSDEPAATPQKSEEHIAPKTSPTVNEQTPTVADVEPAPTLGDVIAQNTQTLADTIAAPTALGEEISHKSIKSLRQGIGLNDKFLMIRDLFDGDSDAYNQAIDALDEFDDFDDCIIYIAENFAWNADSEGAKFIMQLLERKLS